MCDFIAERPILDEGRGRRRGGEKGDVRYGTFS